MELRHRSVVTGNSKKKQHPRGEIFRQPIRPRRQENGLETHSEGLQEAATGGGNVFAVLMDAVRVLSLGQIANALFDVGGQYRRDAVLRHLVDLQYQRNDAALTRARFRVRGDTLEIGPASSEIIVRVEFFGDEVERITELDPLTGELLAERKELNVFPATHFVTPRDKLGQAVADIEAEMELRVGQMEAEGRALPHEMHQRPRERLRHRMLEKVSHDALLIVSLRSCGRASRPPRAQPGSL